jgi:hypothetical protein
MSHDSVSERCVFPLAVVVLGVLLAGNDACREDHFFATQVKIATPTGTAVATATDDADDDELSTDTPTAAPTATPTGPAPTPTLTATVTATVAASGLFREIAEAGEGSTAQPNKGGDFTWLGKSFGLKDKQNGPVSDTDGDGYADWLEDSVGSDLNDDASTPPSPRSRLYDRLQGIDDDADGLTNTDEASAGTSPSLADTDGDGVPDGAELLSGSDALDPRSVPIDSDGDGLGDAYEKARGTDASVQDTDFDGLSDERELALGTDPLGKDSDGDGIFDGKEVALGADPLRAEGI